MFSRADTFSTYRWFLDVGGIHAERSHPVKRTPSRVQFSKLAISFCLPFPSKVISTRRELTAFMYYPSDMVDSINVHVIRDAKSCDRLYEDFFDQYILEKAAYVESLSYDGVDLIKKQ